MMSRCQLSFFTALKKLNQIEGIVSWYIFITSRFELFLVKKYKFSLLSTVYTGN